MDKKTVNEHDSENKDVIFIIDNKWRKYENKPNTVVIGASSGKGKVQFLKPTEDELKKFIKKYR